MSKWRKSFSAVLACVISEFVSLRCDQNIRSVDYKLIPRFTGHPAEMEAALRRYSVPSYSW